jgi:citrate lyase subunit beta/citryl-CoA lyase
VSDWLAPDRPVYVRINATDTAWHRDDLELLGLPGVAGLMVPKAEHLDEALVAACAAHSKTLLPIVETALGFERAGALARTPGVERIAFGTIDFQVDLGIAGDDDALGYFRSRLVLESRLAGIGSPIDGVTTDIGNAEILRHDTERSKRFGFGAKLCIHPSQLPAVNAGFSPSEADIAWAGRVIEAIGRSGGAAVAVDGKMVDRPVVLKAERIVAMARRAPRRR